MSTFPHSLAGLDNAVLVVVLPSALNHDTADPLREDVRSLLPNRDDAALILDCSSVSLITSIGIAALLQIQEHCIDRQAPMFLASVTPPVRRMLEILKLGARFETRPSVGDAIAEIERAG